MPSYGELRREFTTAGVDLILTDLDVALTLMDVAETTRDAETRRRNHRNALHARETILRYLAKLKAPQQDLEAIREKLDRLEQRLRDAGYDV